MLSYNRRSLVTNPRGARILIHIAPARNHQQRLLRTVQKMDEKITIHVPRLQVFGRHDLTLRLGAAQVHDEPVCPHLTPLGDPIFAAAQLANSLPRDGCNLRRGDNVELGHVVALRVPGGLIVWVHAETGPDVRGETVTIFDGDSAWQTKESVLHERSDLFGIDGFEGLLLEKLFDGGGGHVAKAEDLMPKW